MFKDQELSKPTILSLVIEFSAKVKLTFSASECDCDPSASISYINWHWGCNIPLQVILDRELSTVDRIIGDTSPLKIFQSVHFHYLPSSSAFWKHVLGQLQGLRYLKLSHGYMPDLASVLPLTPQDCMENQSGHADRGPNRIVAIALEELELYDIVFPTEPPRRGMDTIAAGVRSLCDALSTCKEPRGRLVMTRCAERHSGKYFDMDGRWEGGRFHVVDKHDSTDTP